MICLFAAGQMTAFAAIAFTLAWTHSIEKTRWEEEWQVTAAGLKLAEARVKGSGAGVDPQAGAELRGGWLVWRPDLRPQQQLVLAASDATGQGWTLCAEGRCAVFGDRPGDPAVVRPCGAHDQ
ncbi:DUF1850 domain-containing protein [Mesorhizobium sp. BAC0120]|uniref:DUF1850 domain-containing protein n=1 Tax=Mesorhizobium sp. BAC0120 TaxID=3090670 RepID=UPI00298CC6D4|nr:DUF1850 domain-containing protein [Mesorhizobium sp. BAC0120]MDW6025585.1 DUF1850 domain-containing protein [Mesorhizobium sp. BAC0120]